MDGVLRLVSGPRVSSADGDKTGGQILESDLMVGEDVFLVVF